MGVSAIKTMKEKDDWFDVESAVNVEDEVKAEG